MKHKVSISLLPEMHQLLKKCAMQRRCTQGELVELFICLYVAMNGTPGMYDNLINDKHASIPNA